DHRDLHSLPTRRSSDLTFTHTHIHSRWCVVHAWLCNLRSSFPCFTGTRYPPLFFSAPSLSVYPLSFLPPHLSLSLSPPSHLSLSETSVSLIRLVQHSEGVLQ